MSQAQPAVPSLQDSPLFTRQGLITIALIIGALWLIAAAAGTTWVTVTIAVLTVALLGGLTWVYFWAKKQQKKQLDMLNLMQAAQESPEARRQVLSQLQAEPAGSQDVMTKLARAQLEAQEDPDKAILTLESLDISQVPGQAADEVRGLRVQLYLARNRIKDARAVADEIKAGAGTNGQSKAMLAAVVAEAFARTGKHDQALALLEDLNFQDPELGQIKYLLLFGRIFANFAAGKKERVRKDMVALASENPQLLGRFVQPGPGIHLDLRKMATEVLQDNPEMRKMQRMQQQAMMRGAR
jgi:hypothetical protein